MISRIRDADQSLVGIPGRTSRRGQNVGDHAAWRMQPDDYAKRFPMRGFERALQSQPTPERVFRPCAFASALAAALLLTAIPCSREATAQARHGIAMHGEPALPPDFRALRYVN